MSTNRPKYTIQEAVLKIVGDHLGIPSTTISINDHIMNDLGADEYDQLELIMTVEELFRVQIDKDKVSRVKTIGNIVSLLEELFPKNYMINL